MIFFNQSNKKKIKKDIQNDLFLVWKLVKKIYFLVETDFFLRVNPIWFWGFVVCEIRSRMWWTALLHWVFLNCDLWQRSHLSRRKKTIRQDTETPAEGDMDQQEGSARSTQSSLQRNKVQSQSWLCLFDTMWTLKLHAAINCNSPLALV